MNILLGLLISLPVLVISISVHEFSHAITGDYLGDPTPRRQGRITLNPLTHLDRLGTLMIVMSSLAGFGIGWGKPVQVNPYNFRTSPRAGMGIVAIAGPISNIILAAIGAIAMRALLPTGYLATFFQFWIIINLALALFNLLPVFPLDGYNVFIAILSLIRQDWARKLSDLWRRQVQYGALFLMLLLILDWQFPALSPIAWIFGAPLNALLNIFLP